MLVGSAAVATIASGCSFFSGSSSEGSDSSASGGASTENYDIGEVDAAGEVGDETVIYRIVNLPDGRFLATGDEKPGVPRTEQFATQISDSGADWQQASLSGIPNGYLLEKAVPEAGGFEGYLIPSDELASQPGYSPFNAPRLMSTDGLNWKVVTVPQPEPPAEGVNVSRFIVDLGVGQGDELVALTNTTVVPDLQAAGGDYSKLCTIPTQELIGTTVRVRMGPCWYNPDKTYVEVDVPLPEGFDGASWAAQTLEFRIYRSSDGGQNWTPDPEPFLSQPHRLPEGTPFDGKLYRMSYDGDDPYGRLEVSTDDGANWAPAGLDAAPLLPEGDWVLTFGAGPEGLGVLAQKAGISKETPPEAGDTGHVLFSGDGTTWKAVGEFAGLSRSPNVTVTPTEVLVPAVETADDPTWKIERFAAG